MAGFTNDVVYAKNGDFSQAASVKGQLSNGLLTNGQMWIGTTTPNVGGTNINVGTITSPDSSVTIGYSSPNITLEVAGGTSTIKTITGNTGGAESPASGNFNFLTANTTVKFAGTSATETLDFGLTNLFLGDPGSNLTSATFSTAYGQLSGTSLTSGIANSFYGYKSGNSITTSVGCTAIGFAAQYLGVSGNYNTSLGYESLYGVVSGTNNIALGYLAGSIYEGASSSNISIGNSGINTTESNTIRIGTQGTGAGQQNRNFQAGITGVTVSASAPVAVDTNGQLSSLGFGTATQVLTSNGAGVSPTWQAAGSGGSSVYFSAYLSSPKSNVTGDGTQYTVIFDTTTSNFGSAYNTGTGVFTAPSTGFYSFSFDLCYLNFNTGQTEVISAFQGSAFGFRTKQLDWTVSTINGVFIDNAATQIYMTSGDTLYVTAQMSGGSKSVELYGQAPTGYATTCLFSGFKVA